VLGLRCASYGYQYSEIVGSLSSVYFCGGDCVEHVTSHLMPHLSLHPTLSTCSSDTILRGVLQEFVWGVINSPPLSGVHGNDTGLRGFEERETMKPCIVTKKWCSTACKRQFFHSFLHFVRNLSFCHNDSGRKQAESLERDGFPPYLCIVKRTERQKNSWFLRHKNKRTKGLLVLDITTKK